MKTTITASGLAPRSLARLGILFWCAIAAALACGHLRVTRGPVFANDSYTYLSVADNFLNGLPGYTSIVHFDSERSFGRVPAPLTTFPLGYPATIGAVRAISGIPISWSACAISIMAFVLLVAVCAHAARLLGVGPPLTRFLLVWLIGNSWGAVFGTSVLTESLFTLTSIAALTVLVSAMQKPASTAHAAMLFAAGGILAGASYWVRYAGLFLLAAIASFFLLRLLAIRNRSSRLAALSVGCAATLVGAGMVRNSLLVGTWKGGNTKSVHHPLASVIHEFALWNYHLLLGGIASSRFGVGEVLLCAGALVLGLVVAAGFRLERGAWTLRRAILARSALPLWYLIAYCAGMVYLGVTSVISFDTRMFYPVLPVMLLLAARGLQASFAGLRADSVRLKVAYAALSVATLGYLVINGRSYFAPVHEAPDRVVAQELGSELPSGSSLRSWLETHVPSGATIVSNRGQASAYVLHRNTVSLISAEYSDQRWDADSIRTLMRTYGAEYIVVYFGDGGDPVLHESSFLSGLARLSPPKWLQLAAHNRDAAVFRVTRDSASSADQSDHSPQKS